MIHNHEVRGSFPRLATQTYEKTATLTGGVFICSNITEQDFTKLHKATSHKVLLQFASYPHNVYWLHRLIRHAWLFFLFLQSQSFNNTFPGLSYINFKSIIFNSIKNCPQIYIKFWFEFNRPGKTSGRICMVLNMFRISIRDCSMGSRGPWNIEIVWLIFIWLRLFLVVTCINKENSDNLVLSFNQI